MSLASRVSGRLRRAWPDRVVHRDVQGVRLTLPWSHRLPDYAVLFPSYGQNLVVIAEVIARVEGEPFVMIDVGANVGDSALQVLDKVDARVLCVEGDEYWLRYLHRNVDAEPRIRVVPALLLPDDPTEEVSAVRRNGTTHFVAGGGGLDAAEGMSPSALRSRGSDLGTVRLVKSDTDGYDARLVPAMAREWTDAHPVLFLEFDPALTRQVGDNDPDRLWSELAALGYDHVVVWDNFGNPLGSIGIDRAVAASRVLDGQLDDRGYHYWDVAVVHRDDATIAAALDLLVGNAKLDVATGAA